MARISVEFVGTGNFAPLLKQIEAVNAGLISTSAQMDRLGARGMVGLGQVQRGFKDAVSSIGGFTTVTSTATTSTARMTEMIKKQEIGLGNYRKALKQTNNIAMEQARLAESVGMIGKREGLSRVSGSMMIPDKAISNMGLASQRLKVYAGIADSVAANTIKMGKNMQWAGRQLTVGLSLPIVALGVASAKAFKQVDEAMTQLLKVYGDLNSNSRENLAQVRADTMQTAKDMSKAYGFMAKDTIELAATFAAMGYESQQLQEIVRSTSRIMMIGDINAETASKGAQSILAGWGLTAAQLTDTFNRLNVIENQTVLSTNDILFAVPQAGAAVRGLGGDAKITGNSVEFMGAALAGMRDRGVAIGKATMAIRSGFADLADPTAKAKRIFEEVNGALGGTVGHLQDIIEEGRAKNGAQGVVENLAKAFGKMNAEQRNRAAIALFHKQEYTQWLNLLSEVNEYQEKGINTQNGYAKAIAATRMSATEAAQVAAAEVKQQTESASNRFKRMKSEVNLALAGMGKPFLNAASTILGFIAKIIDAFQSLPKVIRGFSQTLLTVVAVAGPIIMLVGLVKNLAGQLASAAVKLTKFIFGIKELETEEERFRMLMDGTTSSVKNQTEAFIMLGGAIKRTGESMATMATQQAAAAQNAKIQSMMFMPGPVGANGRPGVPVQIATEHEARQTLMMQQGREEKAVKAQAAAAGKTQGVRDDMAPKRATAQYIGLGRAIGAASMALMLFGTNQGKVMSGVTYSLLMLSMFPSAIKGLAKQVGLLTVSFGWLKTAGATAFASLKGGAIALRGALAAAMPWLALITAAAIGIYKVLKYNQNETNKTWADTADAGKNMAHSLGVGYGEVTAAATKAVNKAKEHQKIIEEFQKSNPRTVENIKALYDADPTGNGVRAAQRAAASIGLDMMKHGASADDAKKGAEAALEATGVAALKVPIQFDFTNGTTVMFAQAEDISNKLGKIANNKFRQSWREGMARGLELNTDKLNEGAQKAAKELAHNWTAALIVGMNDDSARTEMFSSALNAISTFADQYNQVADSITLNDNKQSRGAVRDVLGLDTMDDSVVQAALQNLARGMAAGGDAAKKATQDYNKLEDSQKSLVDAYSQTAQAEIIVTKEIMRKTNISKGEFDITNGLAGLYQYLSKNYGTVSDAVVKYNNAIAEAEKGGKKLDDAEKQSIATRILGEQHIKSISSEMLVMGTAAGVAAEQLAQAKAAGIEWQGHIQNLAGPLKTELQNSTKTYIDQVDTMFDASTDAEQKGYDRRIAASNTYYDKLKNNIDRSAKAEVTASDRSFKVRTTDLTRTYQHQTRAIKKFYNTQINALNAQMAKEKAADDQRKKLFEAEMTRIKRLGEAANASIDLEAALRVGNLDEAARVINTQQVSADTNALEDAAKNGEDASAERLARKQGKVDKLTSARDTKLDAAQKTYDTQKQKLDDEKQAAKDRINLARDTEKERLDAQKSAAATGLENEKSANKARRDELKRAMDAELAIRAEAATTTKEAYQRNLDAINKIALDKGNVNIGITKTYTEAYSNGWGTATTTALKKISESNEWGMFGQRLTEKVVQGLTGDMNMNWDDFVSWMVTGVKPVKITLQEKNTTASSRVQSTASHSGGWAGEDNGRAGRPKNADLYPDEVPVILQKGEYVLNRKAVKNIGAEALDAMNNGRANKPGRMHEGGIVRTVGIALMGAMKQGITAMITKRANLMDDQNIAAGQDLAASLTGSSISGLLKELAKNPAAAKPGQTYPELIRLGVYGPEARVTSTTGGTHAENSLHYRGDAIDLAGPKPGRDSDELLAINKYWAANFAKGLKELIYAGPGSVQVKNGQIVDGYKVFGKTTMDGHHNHVHVGATPESLKNIGIEIPALKRGGVVMNDNTLANLHARETVLTAPLSASLERGIQNMDNSSKSEYNINVYSSPGMDTASLARQVRIELQKAEISKGTSNRKIGRSR